MSDPGKDFERLVVEFCKNNWAAVQENRLQDGRELDVFVDTGSEFLLIECTIERTKKKAENDISKIRDLRRTIFGDAPQKPVRGFFITQSEVSPEVHQVAEQNGSWITACSLPTFINQFNCSTTYLQERVKRPFGSVRNPSNDSLAVDRAQFVPVPLRIAGTDQSLTIDRLIDELEQRKRTRLVVTGDFGIGKSMTFREIFFRLQERYTAGTFNRFPLYINLADSALDEGDDAVDLIERHAKWVGLRDQRDKLVHAWASDGCIVFLDGFDELVRAGFTSLTTSSKDIRYASSHIIRAFINESPPHTPILVSGRESYFATFDEMKQSLGASAFSHVSLHDLTENEVKALYRKILPKGKEPIIFEWLPQRPLLLSYIYFQLRDDSAEVDGIASPPTPGDGWNTLLDKLSKRETNIARGAQPSQIRRLVERVALHARTNIADVGRVTSLHIAQAFREIFEMEPDLSVQQVLMRLPGLTAGRSNEDRSFIDQSFFEASQAGTIVEAIGILATRNRTYIRSETSRRLLDALQSTRSAISDLTASVVISALRSRNQLGELGVALLEIVSDHSLSKGNLLADLLLCATLEPEICVRNDLRSISVRAALIPNLEIEAKLTSRARLSFEDCVIEQLDLSADFSDLKNLRFERTRVGLLYCSSAISERLPELGISNGQIAELALADGTNADVLELNVPENFKVLKICLRKLFRQPGSGRKRAAFFRGIGDIDHRLVDDCLAALIKHRIVYVSGRDTSDNAVLHPNRSHAKRANFLIDTLSTPDDVLLRH
jgi:hypothetical protein